jgi:hypothetical protein
MTKAITVSISNDLAGWLEATARQRGVTKAQVVRDALEGVRMTGPESFFDWRAWSRGLAICRCAEGSRETDLYNYFGGSNCSRPGGKCWSVAFNIIAAIA